MLSNVRRAGAMAAAVLCVMAPSLAHAQSGRSFGGLPGVTGKPPHALHGSASPTPMPTRTTTPTPTATPRPAATPKAGAGDLPETGTDSLALMLAGLSLLGFGVSLRMRLAQDDARRDA